MSFIIDGIHHTSRKYVPMSLYYMKCVNKNETPTKKQL